MDHKTLGNTGLSMHSSVTSCVVDQVYNKKDENKHNQTLTYIKKALVLKKTEQNKKQ